MWQVVIYAETEEPIKILPSSYYGYWTDKQAAIDWMNGPDCELEVTGVDDDVVVSDVTVEYVNLVNQP